MMSVPQLATASSWDPTLLVNTESFQIIDDGDGTSDIYLQFGDSAGEQLIWDISGGTFIFTDDLEVQGNLNVTGSITGATLAGSDLTSCATITTDAAGRLICSDGSDLDGRFVNTSGDVITGQLGIQRDLNVAGSIEGSGGLTINKGNAGDAVLTFGDDVTNETITFNKTSDRFEFSDDVSVTGNIDASGDIIAQGTLSGASLYVSSANVDINGVSYSFPAVNPTNGQVLVSDALGNLTWTTQSTLIANGSGSQLSLHPEYSNAVYTATGSNSVGQLKTLSDDTNQENYYRWSTSKAAAQTYDIVARVRVPENFAAWRTSSGIQLHYKTSNGVNTDNYVRVSVYDTTGTIAYVSPNLANTTWQNQGIGYSDISTGTFAAGGTMTVRITVMARNSNRDADVGFLNFNWMTTTP